MFVCMFAGTEPMQLACYAREETRHMLEHTHCAYRVGRVLSPHRNNDYNLMLLLSLLMLLLLMLLD